MIKNYNMILTGKQQKYQLYHQLKLIKFLKFITGEEILPPTQKSVTEQAKFTYFPLGKAHEKLYIWKLTKWNHTKLYILCIEQKKY